MASRPGFFTEWPWQRLGNFKYLILVPSVVQSTHSYLTKEEGERDLSRFLIVFALLLRLAHAQLWINLARFQTVRSKHLIVAKAIEFDQVDREMNWDDHVVLNGIIFHLSNSYVPGGSRLPWWDVKGVLISVLVHMGPVEFLYYWLHRALHHHHLYARYHSLHHASLVTEPISSVIHPFVEESSYFLLFALPFFCMAYTRSACIIAAVGYLTYVDFMNYMGHCNLELVPLWMFEAFPLLKYLMYHSLHHTQFRTNYCLFMPFYDYIYGTVDMSTEKLYKNSLKGKEETPDVVHLTHLTTLQSIYHLRIGLSSLASKPFVPRVHLWLAWPLSYAVLLLTCISDSAFTLERHRLKKLKVQTWIVPRFSFQYLLSKEKEVINNLIENAIIEAERKGAKVVSLGLLNRSEELNRCGEVYIQKHPNLKIRIVDGSSLAAAVVLRSIPAGTDRVLLRGKPSKTSCAIALALCQRGAKVIVVRSEEFVALKLCVATNVAAHLVLSDDYTPKVWLVGEGLTDQDQRKASSGTCFIPFSQFPVKKAHEDRAYQMTPAMAVPRTLENMHTCEVKQIFRP